MKKGKNNNNREQPQNPFNVTAYINKVENSTKTPINSPNRNLLNISNRICAPTVLRSHVGNSDRSKKNEQERNLNQGPTNNIIPNKVSEKVNAPINSGNLIPNNPQKTTDSPPDQHKEEPKIFKKKQDVIESINKPELDETGFFDATVTQNKTKDDLDKLITAIKLSYDKDGLGLRFLFEIDEKALKYPCYTINYKTTKEKFLATLFKKDGLINISRLIEFSNLQKQVTFIVMDLYSDKKPIIYQEVTLDLSNFDFPKEFN